MISTAPIIIISDYSCYAPDEETAWSETFSRTLQTPTFRGLIAITQVLKSATEYGRAVNGRIPIAHIDSHIEESSMATHGKKSVNMRRNKKGKNRPAYKRYIYAYIQDLYNCQNT